MAWTLTVTKVTPRGGFLTVTYTIKDDVGNLIMSGTQDLPADLQGVGDTLLALLKTQKGLAAPLAVVKVGLVISE